MSLIENHVTPRAETDDDLSDTSPPTVVVAVDARPASADALAWAADEALCRGMPLRIATAFADPDQPDSPQTAEQALECQRRLRRQLEPSRPWLDEAEHVARRGNVQSLLNEATSSGDILVIGEAAGVSAMDPSQRPSCPVVVVPAAFMATFTRRHHHL